MLRGRVRRRDFSVLLVALGVEVQVDLDLF